jgi:polyisoprenoid-binding protein YceI
MTLKCSALTLLTAMLALSAPASAENYAIDTKGAHASINFRVKHLGYSWLVGRFDTFSGTFTYDDKKPEASKISVEIDTKSVNSNHAERDKHLRSADFLNVDKNPKAMFVSKSVKPNGEGKATVTGDFTLNGVTKEVAIDASYMGGGDDPWGGFRQGFEGSTKFKLADFGITKDLGPASTDVELTLHVEGVRQ